jgi:uncharacterized membrane protein YdjX (TVP38/TMEM64 family)
MTHRTKFTIIVVLIGMGVAAGVLLPFFIWGDQMHTYMDSPEYKQKLEEIDAWAWLVIIGLLVSDLVLPVPNTPLMTLAGAMYGWWAGALIAAAGSILAGLVAYGLAYLLGHKGINRIATEKEREQFFDKWGMMGIAAYRAMPVMPEVLTVLAGLARMHFGRFCAALVIGALIVCIPLAYLGQRASDSLETVSMVVGFATLGVWGAYLLILARINRKKCSTESEPYQTDEANP